MLKTTTNYPTPPYEIVQKYSFLGAECGENRKSTTLLPDTHVTSVKKIREALEK